MTNNNKKEQPFTIQNIWENISDSNEEEIIQFWLKSGALHNYQQAQERLKQVIFIARNNDNDIVGISTAYKQYNQPLENYFYYMRAFIHPNYRQSGIARSFALGIIEFFETRFLQKIESDVIGIFLETENQAIKANRKEAIMEKTGFVYIGKNEKGDHLRVRYFKGAHL